MFCYAPVLHCELSVLVPAMRGEPNWFASGLNPIYRAVSRPYASLQGREAEVGPVIGIRKGSHRLSAAHAGGAEKRRACSARKSRPAAESAGRASFLHHL